MKKVLLTIVLVLALLAGACALMNPSKEKHIDAIQEAYMGNLDSKSLDFLDGKSLTKIVLKGTLDYKSYGLCSTGRIMGKDVSFGILGHVFVVDKKN
ncbi:MAG: hypothetical protein J6M37_08020 [Prevotella sp.]|nr:hypothetical protein [Prevotella sp.]